MLISSIYCFCVSSVCGDGKNRYQIGEEFDFLSEGGQDFRCRCEVDDRGDEIPACHEIFTGKCFKFQISIRASQTRQTVVDVKLLGEQGWRSGESTRLPPMWPGFDSRTRRHMWVEFVVGSCPCSERFFSGYSGFTLSSKTNTSKFQFDLEGVPS